MALPDRRQMVRPGHGDHPEIRRVPLPGFPERHAGCFQENAFPDTETPGGLSAGHPHGLRGSPAKGRVQFDRTGRIFPAGLERYY